MENIKINNIKELINHIKASGSKKLTDNPAFDYAIKESIINENIRNINLKKEDDYQCSYIVDYNIPYPQSNEFVTSLSISLNKISDEIIINSNVIKKSEKEYYLDNLTEKDKIPTQTATLYKNIIKSNGANGMLWSNYTLVTTEYQRAKFPGNYPKEISYDGWVRDCYYDEFGIEYIREYFSEKPYTTEGTLNNNNNLFLNDSSYKNTKEIRVVRNNIDAARVIKYDRSPNNYEKIVYDGVSLIEHYPFKGRGYESLNAITGVTMPLSSMTAYQNIEPRQKEYYEKFLNETCTSKQKEGLLTRWWCDRDKYYYSSLEDKNFKYLTEEQQKGRKK